MSYQIVFTRSAEKDLADIPKSHYQNIVEHIFTHEKNPRPHGQIKLKGYSNTYRLRGGVYRILYEIHYEKITIIIIAIAHRKESYD